MPKSLEKLFLITIDFITITIAFFAMLRLRITANLFVEHDMAFRFKMSLFIYGYWLVIFLFFGLYQSWYTKSRFSELMSVLKAVTTGIFLIFIMTLDLEKDLSNPFTLGRIIMVSYWAFVMIFVGGGRMVLHTMHRKLLERGIWQRHTLIVGWNENARMIADKIKKFPALGYKVEGFISLKKNEKGEEHNGLKVLGHIRKIKDLVEEFHVEEVIICLGDSNPKTVMDVIGQCEDLPVNLKIEPDMYQIVLGQARTQQIYGFPLMEIHPDIMKPWEHKVKRIMDLSIALIALIMLSPLLIIVSLLIKIDSRGPILFAQKRVGRNGRIFTIYKFRSMVKDAEKLTGPVWAGQKDPRITRLGRIMRKTRIDELPQLFNVLYGHMSIVGPRPERPYFVDRLKHEYPFYTRRLRVKPGITGWAQVKGEYDTTIEQVKEKLEYDLYYIDNLSLSLDLRILLFTILVVIKGKGQ